MLVLWLVVGCSSSNGSSANLDPDSDEAHVNLAQNYLNELLAMNYEKLLEMTPPSQRDDDAIDVGLDIDPDDEELAKKFINAMFKNGFKAQSASTNGDKSEVKVTFDAPDMKSFQEELFGVILATAFDEEFMSLSEAEQEEKIIDVLVDTLKEIETKSYESTLHLLKEDGNWYVASFDKANEDFLDILDFDDDLFDIED